MRFYATPRPTTSSVLITGYEIPQALVTVYRYNTDGTNTILRGAQNMAVVSGTLTVEDTEAPFDVPLRYVLLFTIAENSPIQRNLITNPSFETDTVSWTAGAFRTITRAIPAIGAAFAGPYALGVGTRAAQVGDSTTVPFEAPLARVNANFIDTSNEYEFSFRTRLSGDSTSYISDAIIITGTADILWSQAYESYTNWMLPYSKSLTWAQLLKSYVGVASHWISISTNPLSSNWESYLGTWDGDDFVLFPEVSARRAINYVTNPAFNSGVAGYTGGSTSGSVPSLIASSGVMIASIGSSTVGPRINFSASNLTVGTDYLVMLDVILDPGMTLNISARNGTVVSTGLTSDDTFDWTTDSVIFTAAATTETFAINFNSNTAGSALIDRVQVSLPEVDYFDGGASDSLEYYYNWVGTANASTSQRVPFGRLYAPTDDRYEQYEVTWNLSLIGSESVEVVAGIIDAYGQVELITPIRTTIVLAGTGTAGYGEGGYGNGLYGTGDGTGGGRTITLPIVNTRDWVAGWRPYIQVGAPGCQVQFSSRYYTSTQPTFTPYSLGVSARVLNPSGTVVLTSPKLAQVTVNTWSECRWLFTLPAMVPGQYKMEIVPEVVFPSAITTWQIDAAMLEAAPFQDSRLNYLDGDVPVPSSVGWLTGDQLGPYDRSTDSAIIQWVDTPHASISEYVGPNHLTVVRETMLVTPVSEVDVMPDCEPINLTDPTVPTLSAWFTLSSLGDLTYAARSTSFVILNRRSPVVVSQTRASAAGSMTLLLQTMPERQRLLDLIASGRVLMLRNPNPAYPESNWYLAVDSVQEVRIAPDHRLPYRRFTLEFQVVDRPGGLIAQPAPTTWAEVQVFESWGTDLAPNSVLANVESWTELISQKPQVDNPLADFGAYAINSGGV